MGSKSISLDSWLHVTNSVLKCKKNKETAVYYFKIAADLNDADAQNDLGHCYYHGHGVKKDMFMAAKYYRKADKQGQGIMGNSWIWKSKYDAGPPSRK